MPFSENSMGQVTTILDFLRLNIMTTLSAEFPRLWKGFFLYSNLTAVAHGEKSKRNIGIVYVYMVYYIDSELF